MPNRQLPQKFLVAFSFAGEQRELVRSIAQGVEQCLGSSSVFLDEWFEYYIAGDDADLKLMKIYGRQCELVVVCVSERYGDKAWTQAEHRAIRDRLMQISDSSIESDRHRILPIRVGDGDVPGILLNAFVPDVRKKSLAESVALIVDRLRLILPGLETIDISSTQRTWPTNPIPFKHNLADRAVHEWPAVLRLLTAGASKQILMFEGPSGFSKSALLGAAARYAKILQVPVAYIDFKDTGNLIKDSFIREIQFALAVDLPSSAVTKEPDPSMLLRKALRDRKDAALIILDTYEKVTRINALVQWIETKLLAEAGECEYLRFLIGGQKVPDSRNALWRDLAEKIELDPIKDQSIWKEWIHELNPNVDDKHIESIVVGCQGVPGNIVPVLETFAREFLRIV